MIKATIIFGEDRVNHYDECGTIKVESNIDGYVDEIEFRTKEELDAYNQGLNDADGWGKILSIDPTYSNTTDCGKCSKWREYFKSEEGSMYCPFCRKLLSKPDFETISFNGHEFNVRTLNNAGNLTGCKISTDNLNEMLLNEDEEYISEEARHLDESIMYFVPLDKIVLPDSELTKYISTHMR